MAIEKANELSRIFQSGTTLQLREVLVPIAPNLQFENVSSTSMYVVLSEVDLKSSEEVICFELWHRKVEERTYRGEPMCMLRPEIRFLISNFQLSTKYVYKIVAFTKNRVLMAHLNVPTMIGPFTTIPTVKKLRVVSLLN